MCGIPYGATHQDVGIQGTHLSGLDSSGGGGDGGGGVNKQPGPGVTPIGS